MWHDGCIVWLVPHLSFRGLQRSHAGYQRLRDAELPGVSNDSQKIPRGALFPVFDMDRAAIAALTFESPGQPTSPLYLLDFEMDQLTMVAHSMGAFINHLVRELETGNFEITEHGLMWKRDPLRFSRSMTPLGEAST